MRPTNRGATSLKRRRRNATPMGDYDRLRPELRAWLAGAVLPWSPRSVRRSFERALSRTKCVDQALGELNRLQARAIVKDAEAVWGPDHPTCSQDVGP